MRFHIIAVGKKMPAWVEDAFHEYAKRFTKPFSLALTEISPETNLSNVLTGIEREGEKILTLMNAKPYHLNSLTLSLDAAGSSWTNQVFTDKVRKWQVPYSSLNLIIGGANGLSKAVKEASHECWSLSPLIFPHALVRIMLIEQLYRTMTMLTHHPYHRG